MNKNVILILGLFLLTGLVLVSRDSFASSVLEEDSVKEMDLVLEDNNNIDEFRNKILDYIDLIDNSLIPNTSYDLSNKLNENYDFLTKFAISFILDNREYYDVVDGEVYKYIDEYGNEYSTYEYIKLDMIYEIINNVFGIEYYYILNDYIEIDDEMVPLIELEDISFDGKIDDIVDIDKYKNYIDVIIKYEDNEIDYVYRLENIDNRYVVSNLSIRE